MKFAIKTLGCKVNTYESNYISEQLKKNNFEEVTFTKEADIYIINTCSVTNKADSKSMQLINRVKKNHPKSILVVIGCFVQTNMENTEKFENIDILLGNKDKEKLVAYIKKFIENKKQIKFIEEINETDFDDMIIESPNQTRAFVKIQDGCNNFCSYCIIPFARGRCRSRDKNSALKEIENLVKSGYKEIVLTGIHTGAYGIDINSSLSELLEDILKIKELKRLRISSIEITELDNKFLNLLSKNKILVDHMHIPLQSGSNPILKKMNRKYKVEEFEKIIKNLKKIRPNMLITTDVIVGFPGETKELFLETLEFVRKINFFKVHVFPYSRRKGTVADEMINHIDEKEKKERVKALMNLSEELEKNHLEKLIDKVVEVIPETYNLGTLTGHTGSYITVSFKGSEKLLKKIVEVKIEKIENFKCIGKYQEKR